MLRQQYAEQATTEQDADAPSVGRTLPQWRVVLRKSVGTVLERTLGECWAPNPRTGLLVLLLIIGLLGIIAVTLSVGNALLVLVVSVVMRVSCDRRGPFARRRA
jgi:hypothetical protein